MNFLALCKAVARDSGTVAGIPNFTTVASASGRIEQVIGWTADAWIDIQNERNDWLWMRQTFEKALIADTPAYTPASWSMTRVSRWLEDRINYRTMTLYDPAIGREDEGTLAFISYDCWRETYDRGVHDNQRPSHWSISPTNEFLVGPTPDKVYNVRGEYRLKPQVLALDDDIPEMPEEYHRLIVVEAIRLMARSDEAMSALATYGTQYDRLRNALVREQTPQVDMWAAGPAA